MEDFRTAFLCHASTDKEEWVRPVAEELQRRNITFWLDEAEIRWGDSIIEKVGGGLKMCQYVLVFLSDSFLDPEVGRWSKEELRAAMNQSISELRTIVLPLLIGDSRRMLTEYPFLRDRQYLRWPGSAAGVADELEKLVSAVPGPHRLEALSERRVGRPSDAPPVPVILVGCGQWAREATVFPLREKRPDLLDIKCVTNLLDGDFKSLVRPALSRAGIEVPPYRRTLMQSIDHVRDNLKDPERAIAVVINTPNAKHFHDAEVAIQMGCHVYAERPADHMAEGFEQLVAKANSRQVLFYTGVQRRLEATFRYFHQALKSGRSFGRLASVRCLLGSGHPLEGWRRSQQEAGGGIVLDEGYHLLDAAAWIVESAHPGLALKTEDFEVRAEFRNHTSAPDIERTAIGTVWFKPVDVRLVFDFEKYYEVPKPAKGNVFELLEIRDEDGNAIRLIRDRRGKPGRIQHDFRGETIYDGFTELEDDQAVQIGETEPRRADTTGPLRQFLSKVPDFEPSTENGRPELRKMGNECDARFVMNTQYLIEAIYGAR